MSTTYAVGQRITATVLQALADATVNKGITRLIQQSGQSLANSTDVALTFGAGSENVDTGNFHNEVTNNTRITPSVAGYYTFYAVLYLPASTAYTSIQVLLKQNGTTNLPSSVREGPNATSSARSLEVTIPSILMNGTTDYVEVMGNQVSGSSQTTTSAGGSTSCLFGCVFERPA